MTSTRPAKKRVSSAKGSNPISAPEQLAVISHVKPLVFISHDNRDADLAEAFANLLVDVSAGTLKSFRSSDKRSGSGIEFGTEWYNAIMSQLNDATDVVALLTQRSLDRPWILYEAGVAKGRLETNVLGIALGVPLEKVSSGPFGQFQNCGDDEDSLTKLVIQLLERNPEASPREEAIRRQVAAFLTNTETLRAPKGQPTNPAPTDETNVAKLFEEVKVMFRELPARVDERVQSFSKRTMSRRLRRFDPSHMEELMFHPPFEKNRFGPAAAWLMIISMFRDDVPWLYDVGIEFYKTMRNGSKRRIEEGRSELIAILELATHTPILEGYSPRDGEDTRYLLHRLPEIVHHLTNRAIALAPNGPSYRNELSLTRHKIDKNL